MAINENTSVVRIPVADPKTRKEGLLNIVLPKECFAGQEAPEFWGCDTVQTSDKAAHGNEQPPAPPTEREVRAAAGGQPPPVR